jgi:hypothetical protein
MAGNVEEMVDAYYFRSNEGYTYADDLAKIKADDPSGVTRGGSWRDPGYYALVSVRQNYTGKDFSSNKMGFRLVMDVVEF